MFILKIFLLKNHYVLLNLFIIHIRRCITSKQKFIFFFKLFFSSFKLLAWFLKTKKWVVDIKSIILRLLVIDIILLLTQFKNLKIKISNQRRVLRVLILGKIISLFIYIFLIIISSLLIFNIYNKGEWLSQSLKKLDESNSFVYYAKLE